MMLFGISYVFGFMVCIVSVILCVKLGVGAIYRHGKVAVFWSDFPFGMGYPAAVGLAGFSVFPVINGILAIAIVVWSTWRMHCAGLRLSDLLEENQQ